MDLSVPFRGSLAVSSGALTRGVLAGPRFRRVFPDVYVPAHLKLDLVLRSVAAALLVHPVGVLCGYSAAELLGASCGPLGALPEVTVRSSRHRVPGLVVHRARLAPDEICTVDGTRVTSPLRTAFDLVRWLDRVEGVVALDALARKFDIQPDHLRAMRSRHLGSHGGGRIEPALRLTHPGAASPMESRIRLALHDGGLPPPCVQYRVLVNGRRFELDLAYPSVKLGVEHDGRHHLDAAQARRDLEREGLLGTVGWKIIRFDPTTVLHGRHLVAARTATVLRERGFPDR